MVKKKIVKKMPEKKKTSEKKNTEEKETIVSCHQYHHHYPQSKVIACSGNCELKYGLGCLKRNYAETVPKKSTST
ncbi:hypothetical protein Tco_0573856 [Tanacetum coccineum]